MDSQNITANIKQIFGKYPMPEYVGGFPREPWQDMLERTPLDQIGIDDLHTALLHIFPGHYGNVSVFRYLLTRTLPLFISYYEDQGSNNLYYDSHKSVDMEKLIKKGAGQRWRIKDIAQKTGEFCTRWKAHLKEDEIAVIDEIFRYASQKYCYKKQIISPYFFTLFILWEKDFEKVLLYLKNTYSEDLIDFLREEVREVLLFYENKPNMSLLLAILGIYRKGICLKELGLFKDSITLGCHQVADYFTADDIKNIDVRLKEFLCISE